MMVVIPTLKGMGIIIGPRELLKRFPQGCDLQFSSAWSYSQRTSNEGMISIGGEYLTQLRFISRVLPTPGARIELVRPSDRNMERDYILY